jgi:excisionase family DNA binding protein
MPVPNHARDVEALLYRVQGWTFERIATRMGYSNKSAAQKAVVRATKLGPEQHIPDSLVDEQAAATRLGVSERMVRKLAASGRLERVKVGTATRYRSSDLDRIVKHGTASKI